MRDVYFDDFYWGDSIDPYMIMRMKRGPGWVSVLGRGHNCYIHLEDDGTVGKTNPLENDYPTYTNDGVMIDCQCHPNPMYKDYVRKLIKKKDLLEISLSEGTYIEWFKTVFAYL